MCLARSQIESIVESRPRGKNLLNSNARFLHLLGRGSRYEIPSDNDAPLFVVLYSEREINELKRVIEYAQSDVKSMESEGLIRSIMRSFAKGDRGPTPPKNRCFLSKKSISQLRDIGLPIHRKDFFGTVMNNRNNLPQIAKAIMSDNGSILDDCVFLLRHLLSEIDFNSPIIQQVIDLGVVPRLVCLLERDDNPAVQQDVVETLGEMAWNGTSTQAEAVVKAGIIPALRVPMRSTKPSHLMRNIK